MIKFLLHLLLGLCVSAVVTSRFALGSVVATPSLSDALNPDGTLKLGITGSFDARIFRMRTAPDGRPMFRPAGAAGAGDERWQAGFGISNGAAAQCIALCSQAPTCSLAVLLRLSVRC